MNVLLFSSALVLFVIFLIYKISKRKFNYWHKKNVPYATPLPILGNYGPYILLREYSGIVVQKLCQKFPKEPYFGAFFGTEPVLIVQDPDILKQVLTKDFWYFNGREASEHTQKEVITRNMFFTSGKSWKFARQTLTPLFSSAKIKNMFYLIDKCARSLEDMLDYETSISGVIEGRDTMARYTMDCICSCAFGIESNTMGKGETNNPFKFMALEIFRATYYRGFKLIFRALWPSFFYGFGFQCFPPDISMFFSKVLKEVFDSRLHKPSSRNDFVDLLLNMKNESLSADNMNGAKLGDDKKLYLQVDDDFLTAQCVLFFAAGFETSSTMLGFLLYELAKNQEAQTRAIEEVDAYLRLHDNKLNYDCVKELSYLDACVAETLRLYPVIGNLTREVMEGYTFADGLHVDKGVRIHIPVYHIHLNPEYYPEPHKFVPERFLGEAIKKQMPYTYLPFGEGPRICIGKRFSKMQVLPGLVTVLKKFRVDLAEGVPTSIPLDSRTLLIQPRSTGLYLKVTERDGWKGRVYA